MILTADWGIGKTALWIKYTVSIPNFSKISMVKHLQVYATSRKAVSSFKKALFLQNIPKDNLWCYHLSQYSEDLSKCPEECTERHPAAYKYESLRHQIGQIGMTWQSSLKCALVWSRCSQAFWSNLRMKKYSLSDPPKTDTFLPENLAACRLTEDVKDYSSKAKRRETGIWHQRNYCLSIRGMAMNQSYWALKAIPLYKLCSELYQTSQPLPLWVLSLCHTWDFQMKLVHYCFHVQHIHCTVLLVLFWGKKQKEIIISNKNILIFPLRLHTTVSGISCPASGSNLQISVCNSNYSR